MCSSPVAHLQAVALVDQRNNDAQGPPPPQSLDKEAEYAKLRIQHIYVGAGSGHKLPAAVDVLTERSLERLAPGSAALRASTSRMNSLWQELWGREPDLDSPEFAQAVACLAIYSIGNLQKALERMAQQVCIRGECVHRHLFS
jgi:hypothetical protein